MTIILALAALALRPAHADIRQCQVRYVNDCQRQVNDARQREITANQNAGAQMRDGLKNQGAMLQAVGAQTAGYWTSAKQQCLRDMEQCEAQCKPTTAADQAYRNECDERINRNVQLATEQASNAQGASAAGLASASQGDDQQSANERRQRQAYYDDGAGNRAPSGLTEEGRQSIEQVQVVESITTPSGAILKTYPNGKATLAEPLPNGAFKVTPYAPGPGGGLCAGDQYCTLPRR